MSTHGSTGGTQLPRVLWESPLDWRGGPYAVRVFEPDDRVGPLIIDQRLAGVRVVDVAPSREGGPRALHLEGCFGADAMGALVWLRIGSPGVLPAVAAVEHMLSQLVS